MFSIIIPCQKFNSYLKECLENILKQEYSDPDETQESHGASFEIIILPDENVETRQRSLSTGQTSLVSTKIKIIPTGPVLPGKKRNIGAREAKGEFLAFIDDDAYPSSDWLKNAAKYFEDENIMAIGGPGLTPPDDSFWQQVSGAMYLSWLSGANPERFYPIDKAREVDDWPSMNFFVRRADFLAVGGFDEKYWPGEDTALCHNLVKAGKKIIYAPDVLVYHHRRKNLLAHLKQGGNHKRGLFARLYPANSLKIKYFLPSLFLLFVLFGWLLLFLPQPFNLIYPALWILYFLVLIISLIQIYVKIKKIKVALATLIYIPLTHFWYGWGFLRGVLLPKQIKKPV